MHPYRPESTYVSPPGTDALEKAMEDGRILQAMCVKCDEHRNLHLDLGGQRGIIPRAETAMGLAEGLTREIAVLSRVGRAVSFRVLGKNPDGSFRLSRRAAQLEAKEYFFSALRPGDILQVRVQSAGAAGAFCDMGCGFTALMPIGRCCICRLRSAAELHQSGSLVCAALWKALDESGRICLSGREALGTWEENAALFRQGQTVPAVARSVMPYGIFVELTPNLSGLAEPMAGIFPGDAVSVFIRAIQPGKHKIKLNILQKLPAPIPAEPVYFVTSGHLSRWDYYPGSSAVTCF